MDIIGAYYRYVIKDCATNRIIYMSKNKSMSCYSDEELKELYDKFWFKLINHIYYIDIESAIYHSSDMF